MNVFSSRVWDGMRWIMSYKRISKLWQWLASEEEKQTNKKDRAISTQSILSVNLYQPTFSTESPNFFFGISSILVSSNNQFFISLFIAKKTPKVSLIQSGKDNFQIGIVQIYKALILNILMMCKPILLNMPNIWDMCTASKGQQSVIVHSKMK